jgi:hypothetical protein
MLPDRVLVLSNYPNDIYASNRKLVLRNLADYCHEIAKYSLYKTKAKSEGLGKLDGLLCCLSKLRFNMESKIRILQLVEY